MRRKIIDPDERFQEGKIVESWSKVRVLIALVVIAGIAALGYILFTKAQSKAARVLGAESPKIDTQNVHLPTRADANKVLNSVKQELNNLTSDNLTSSQAALQKIITDLQMLQSGKGNAADLICNTICGK